MASLCISTLEVPDGVRACLTQLNGNYEIERFDVKASSGYLFFGKNRVLQTSVAIKFYYWDGIDAFHAEPRSLAEIDSPNVLHVYDAGYADKDLAYFITPYCSGGDLDSLISEKRYRVREAISLVCGILQGLAFLHSRRIVHRDIKPANIYLQDYKIPVIGDFGSVRRIPEGHAAVPASRHAILYRPPETFASGTYGLAGDIYQVGVVLFQLLGGYLPYEATAWLSRKELTQYGCMPNAADQAIFVDQCLAKRICSGTLLDFRTLPLGLPHLWHEFYASPPTKRQVKDLLQLEIFASS